MFTSFFSPSGQIFSTLRIDLRQDYIVTLQSVKANKSNIIFTRSKFFPRMSGIPGERARGTVLS